MTSNIGDVSINVSSSPSTTTPTPPPSTTTPTPPPSTTTPTPPPMSTYENTTYGIKMQYPSDWSVTGTNGSATVFVIFYSPGGAALEGAATVSLGTELLNGATSLDNYVKSNVLHDYENSTNFPDFNLLQLRTNSTLAGNTGYTLIGTYYIPSSGPQILMNVGTIIGGKAYFVQYMADSSGYSKFFPSVQKMIQSFQVTTSKAPITASNQSNNSSYSVSYLLDKADALFNQGKYTQAIQFYDKVLVIDPNDSEALDGKGGALDNIGNYRQAIPYFDKALTIDPNFETALNNKGIALSNLGSYTQAIQYYNKALAIDPRDENALNAKQSSLDALNASTLSNNKTVYTSMSIYENRTFGIKIQYPSDWTAQGSNDSGELINVATFVSPTGPASNPTADVAIYVDGLHNSTTELYNYANYSVNGYENSTNFPAFKLIQLVTNSTFAGRSAYILIGSYQDPSAGPQKLSEIGTIVGDKAYSIQYIADAPSYSELLPTVQKMIHSFKITIKHK